MTEATATPTKAKATRAEVKKRISKVADMLLLGVRRAAIVQYASEHWQVTERHTDTYIKRATESFKQQATAIDRDAEYGRAVQRMEMIYSACYGMKDYGRALAAAKEIHSLMALYLPPAKQTLKIEGLDQFALLAEKARAVGVEITDLLAAMVAELSGDDPR